MAAGPAGARQKATTGWEKGKGPRDLFRPGTRGNDDRVGRAGRRFRLRRATPPRGEYVSGNQATAGWLEAGRLRLINGD